jgi:preprotein translocase subunit SecE
VGSGRASQPSRAGQQSAGSTEREGGRWKIEKLATMADDAGRFDTVREAAGGRFERMRLFLSEVRNELKRVTWPSQKEVYATTVVVILTSVFFGVYLFALDFGLLKLVQWIFRLFGVAGPTA